MQQNTPQTTAMPAKKPVDPNLHSSMLTLEPIQLPIWPQELRALPNAFARSALFNVAHSRAGERANLKRHTIASVNGLQITYTGEELRQDDEDVFLQVMHLARMHHLGTVVHFSAHAMLRELGWTVNSGSYIRLQNCLDRLKANAIAVTVEGEARARENYTGSLIRSFKWRENDHDAPLRQWEILLEREIIALFSNDTYSRLDWKTRLKLPPLAKWLHSFYHSHLQPFPYKVETLHKLTGSEIEELRKFRYALKGALQKLVDCGFLVSAEIDKRTDTVIVERNVKRLALEQ